MANSHDVTLLESDMDEIVRVVREMIIPTPSQLEAMAMAKFPVKMIKLNGTLTDFYERKRKNYLSALTDLAKLMGGDEG